MEENKVDFLVRPYFQTHDFSNLTPEEFVKKYYEVHKEISKAHAKHESKHVQKVYV